MSKLLSNFSVLTFDCYGTLIDWETGIFEGLSPLAEKSGLGPGKDAILEAHAKHEAEVEESNPTWPYRDVLKEVYFRIASEWGVAADADGAQDFGLSAGRWEPFPDTIEALGYLKRHFSLGILSNVDHANFSGTLEKLEVEFDHVFLAEDIGSYKPSLANFRYMLERLDAQGISKENILHTAESLFHDHVPANRIGLASCWIHRRAGKEGFGATSVPGSMPDFDFRFESLAEMAEAHKEEFEEPGNAA